MSDSTLLRQLRTPRGIGIAIAISAGAGIGLWAWWHGRQQRSAATRSRDVQAKGDTAATPTAAVAFGTPQDSTEDANAPGTKVVQRKVGTGSAYTYDVRMTDHMNTQGPHPECPDRIVRMYDHAKSQGLLERMTLVEARPVVESELKSVHEPRFLDFLFAEEDPPMGEFIGDVFFSKGTPVAASLAAGSAVELSLRVWRGDFANGAAIIRPPGHHAESSKAMGFCYYNNVAVAARAVQADVLPGEETPRILILDWDVHHGNGTQHMFEDDPSVLYISLHRYGRGFYPGTGAIEEVGEGPGTGYNINIAWEGKGLGDPEYVLAFRDVILPVAQEFNPDLVLVSAGFDAAEGDPLGKMRVTPEGYGWMTRALASLAQGRIVVLLEGGYHLTAISYSMESVLRALLGEKLEPMASRGDKPKELAVTTLQRVREAHSEYWACLRSNEE
eukprot:TRINITY_DN4708_c0_g1_i1.p1 TRINITY_DN4708_c0_g1~~TRINITY_DN4708_c0_g1_i1.p1  ORF type:complete len:444 (+),score=80.43 TRINITY_DN4708_c0_g1_i1:131-1462(+)